MINSTIPTDLETDLVRNGSIFLLTLKAVQIKISYSLSFFGLNTPTKTLGEVSGGWSDSSSGCCSSTGQVDQS